MYSRLWSRYFLQFQPFLNLHFSTRNHTQTVHFQRVELLHDVLRRDSGRPEWPKLAESLSQVLCPATVLTRRVQFEIFSSSPTRLSTSPRLYLLSPLQHHQYYSVHPCLRSKQIRHPAIFPQPCLHQLSLLVPSPDVEFLTPALNRPPPSPLNVRPRPGQ